MAARLHLRLEPRHRPRAARRPCQAYHVARRARPLELLGGPQPARARTSRRVAAAARRGFALRLALAFALALVDLRERAMAALARRRLLRHQQQLVGSALHVAGKRQVWRATRAAPLARGATEVLVEGRAGAQHPVAVELRGWV